MTTIAVNESRCPKNHPCPVVRFCPTGAVVQKSWNSAPVIEKDNCADCGRCVMMCGYGAFEYSDNAK